MDEEVEPMYIVKKWKISVLLGPPTALLSISMAMTGTVLTDLIVYRTCLISVSNNATECLMVRTNPGSPESMELEAEIEPYASMIVMTKSLIESLLPAVICLFLGTWSDRGGRRPLFLAAFSGYILTFTTLSLMSNWDTSPWYLLLALIPVSLTAGVSTVRLASVCYIVDTTVEKDRSLQLALLMVSTWSGAMFGGWAGSSIHENYGYTHVFGVAAVSCGIALAWIYFFVSETVQNSSKASIRGLLKISVVTELRNSVLMKRESFHRSIIWLSIFTLVLNIMIFQVDTMTIGYLFTRTRLGWDVQKFSCLIIADSGLRIVGLFGVFLRSYIPGAKDTLLATIGIASALAASVTRSLTWKDWHMYLSLGIGVFNEITIPAVQSIISTFVPSREIGKVFSLIELLQVLSLLAGTPLYTLIYSYYLPPIYPSPVYLFSTSLLVFSILCMICIEVLIRRSHKSSNYIPTAQEDF